MDTNQAFQVVYGRLKEHEPDELAMKIIGFLILKYGDEEMIRLAHSPDQAFECVVKTIKNEMCRLLFNHPMSPPLNQRHPVVDVPSQFNRFSPHRFSSPVAIERSHAFSSPVPIERPMPNWDARALHDEPVNGSPFSIKQHHDAPGDLQVRALSNIINPGPPGENIFANCKNIFFPGSLKRLEMEITGLLKMNRGEPIPIASLPRIYTATYGRAQQPDGYLIESQRNGKAGHSLMNLLDRLKNRICIIDKPHGQHSIILAEDLPKYFEYRSGRNSPVPTVSASRNIYLTFPAESTFTIEDAAQYFSTFGKVDSVRLSCQQERMFGFITFSSPKTVKNILQMENPHVFGGSRVLVKPYRKKSELPDRRFIEHPVHNSSPYADMDSEFLSSARGLRLLRMQEQPPMEEYVQQGPDKKQPLRALQLASQNDCWPDSPNNQITTDVATNCVGPYYAGLESAQQDDGLPDSPFSYEAVLRQLPPPHNHQRQV